MHETVNSPTQTDDSKIDMSVDIAGLRLANPLMTASGTCGYAWEYQDFVDLTQLGAFVTKSVTRHPRPGNETYRIVETRGGMLNAIGLANIGRDAFMRDKLPELQRMRAGGPRIVVNVAGHSTEDYVDTVGPIADAEGVDAIELNVSCPNVGDGLVFGTDPAKLEQLIRNVKGEMPAGVPLIVKLSPNVGDITETARGAVQGGADVLSMINTYTAMCIDIHKQTPRLANGTGGLSGPAVRPLAVYLVQRVYREVAHAAGIPIIGMGGIQLWQDAAEFVIAGATGLAVGTALFVDPATPVKIVQGLRRHVGQLGLSHLTALVGSLRLPGDG